MFSEVPPSFTGSNPLRRKDKGVLSEDLCLGRMCGIGDAARLVLPVRRRGG